MSLSAILGSARRALGERHASAWVAGGAVRDALLGREPADLDLAVDVEDVGELARAIARGAGAAAVTLDAERDVHRIVSRDDAASIDLTRADGGIGPDLLRRDFTINAMALPLQLWPNVAPSQVVDPAGGLEDLRAKRLRAVSEEVLAADPVRMARAVRLCAELGFEMEPQTAAWTAAGAGRITSSAGERVRDELVRLDAPTRHGAPSASARPPRFANADHSRARSGARRRPAQGALLGRARTFAGGRGQSPRRPPRRAAGSRSRARDFLG